MDREINSYAILKNVDTTPFVAFRAFADYPEIVCGFSTRLGGVSTGEFASMNLGFGRGDDDGRVMENYRRIAGSMGRCMKQRSAARAGVTVAKGFFINGITAVWTGMLQMSRARLFWCSGRTVSPSFSMTGQSAPSVRYMRAGAGLRGRLRGGWLTL